MSRGYRDNHLSTQASQRDSSLLGEPAPQGASSAILAFACEATLHPGGRGIGKALRNRRVIFVVGCCPREHLAGLSDPRCRRTIRSAGTEVWLTPEQVAAAKLVVESLELEPVGGLVVTSGHVTFDNLRVAHVLSPVTGRVVKIEAHLGQRVEEG